MTEDLKQKLGLLGWTAVHNSLRHRENKVDWIACKRLGDLPNCDCNDKSPQLVITPYVADFHGQHLSSATIDLTAEKYGEWFKLQMYSIALEDLLDTLILAEDKLSAAWQAIAG